MMVLEAAQMKLKVAALVTYLLAAALGVGTAQTDPCEQLASGEVLGWSYMLQSKIEDYCTPAKNQSDSGEAQTLLDVKDSKSVLPTNELVNDPNSDSGNNSVQSETSLAVSGSSVCTLYNDFKATKTIGFSQSSSAGSSFLDLNEISDSFADPSVVFRQFPGGGGEYLLVGLRPIQGVLRDVSNGLGLWASSNCLSFQHRSYPDSSVWDDKVFLTADNNQPGSSPYSGRLYVVFVDFDPVLRPIYGGNIYLRYSDDGGSSWSVRRQLTSLPDDDTPPYEMAQGPWPAVGPNGDVYVAWARYHEFMTRWNPDQIDIEVAKSTDGGATWTMVSNPLTGGLDPYDPNYWVGACGKPLLNEDIRINPFPQIAVGQDNVVHVVYSMDPGGYPGGFNSGDVIDVYYRNSTNGGTSWNTEVRLNDDSSTTDQWNPSLSVGPNGTVVTAWYDRRMDPAGNSQFDYFARMSVDNGASWIADPSSYPSFRLTTASSDVDPRLSDTSRKCYHGDYDQSVQSDGYTYLTWSDDRNTWYDDPSYPLGRPDPDVWFERLPSSNIGFLRGRVWTSDTGDGIVGAKIEGFPAVYNRGVSQLDGEYFLPIGAGTYNFSASAAGYPSRTAYNISVSAGQTVALDFDLAGLFNDGFEAGNSSAWSFSLP